LKSPQENKKPKPGTLGKKNVCEKEPLGSKKSSPQTPQKRILFGGKTNGPVEIKGPISEFRFKWLKMRFNLSKGPPTLGKFFQMGTQDLM